jgi:hypothetical protein
MIKAGSELDSLNPTSPLSVTNAVVELIVEGVVFTGKMQSAVRQSPTVISLNIFDDMQSRLQYQEVIGQWEGTPAYIARQILLEYGIQVDNSSFGNCIGDQTLAGLQFRYTSAIEDKKPLQDALSELSVAGFMRIAFYNSTAYAIMGLSPEALVSQGFTISASDLWGFPSETDRSGTVTSGGTVKTSIGETVIASVDTTKPEFTADFSIPPMELLNPSGAFFLIGQSALPARKTAAVTLHTPLARGVRPGDWVNLAAPILGSRSAVAQIVGVSRESSLKSSLQTEVSSWID